MPSSCHTRACLAASVYVLSNGDWRNMRSSLTYVSLSTAPALSSISLLLISLRISSTAFVMNLASSFLFARRPRIRSCKVRSHIYPHTENTSSPEELFCARRRRDGVGRGQAGYARPSGSCVEVNGVCGFVPNSARASVRAKINRGRADGRPEDPHPDLTRMNFNEVTCTVTTTSVTAMVTASRNSPPP
jgi:hypothetical protein